MPTAIRKLVRRNDKLQVVYYDANSGQEVPLNALTGYTIMSANNGDQTFDGTRLNGGSVFPAVTGIAGAAPTPTSTPDTTQGAGSTKNDEDWFNSDEGKAWQAQNSGGTPILGNLDKLLKGDLSGYFDKNFGTGDTEAGTEKVNLKSGIAGSSTTTAKATPSRNDGLINSTPATNEAGATTQLASLEMDNAGAKRNKDINPDLKSQLQMAVTAVYGPDYTIKVISGGQDEGNAAVRKGEGTGTRRHGTLDAADVFVVDPSGKTLSGDALKPLAQHWLGQNIGSVGFPLSSSQSMHLDLIGGKVPGSIPLKAGEGRYWTYGGTQEQQSSIKGFMNAALTKGEIPNYVVPFETLAQKQDTQAQTQYVNTKSPHPAQTPTVPQTAGPAGEQAITQVLQQLKQSVGDNTPVSALPNANPSAHDEGVLGLKDAGVAPQKGVQTENISSGQNWANGMPYARPVEQAGNEQMAGGRPNVPNIQTSDSLQMLDNPEWQQQSTANSTAPWQIPDQTTQALGTPVATQTNLKEALRGANTVVKPTVDPDAAYKDAFLTQINKAEGSPSYNTLFGNTTVDLTAAHPDQKIAYNDGKAYSTAAGYAQITNGTWNAINQQYFNGSLAFNNEADQKTAAWKIAEVNYSTKTGRDLLTDLKSGQTSAIQSAFVNSANQWSSLPGGKQPQTNLSDLVTGFNTSLAAYKPPETYGFNSPWVTAAAPAAVAQAKGFDGAIASGIAGYSPTGLSQLTLDAMNGVTPVAGASADFNNIKSQFTDNPFSLGLDTPAPNNLMSALSPQKAVSPVIQAGAGIAGAAASTINQAQTGGVMDVNAPLVSGKQNTQGESVGSNTNESSSHPANTTSGIAGPSPTLGNNAGSNVKQTTQTSNVQSTRSTGTNTKESH